MSCIYLYTSDYIDTLIFWSCFTQFQFHSSLIPVDSCGFLRIPADSGAIPEDFCRNGRGTVKYCFETTLCFIQIATSVVEKSQILSVAFHLAATVHLPAGIVGNFNLKLWTHTGCKPHQFEPNYCKEIMNKFWIIYSDNVWKTVRSLWLFFNKK